MCTALDFTKICDLTSLMPIRGTRIRLASSIFSTQLTLTASSSSQFEFHSTVQSKTPTSILHFGERVLQNDTEKDYKGFILL